MKTNLKTNLKAKTPMGAFAVFTNQLRSGSYAAAVVYQFGADLDHHVEEGDTEQQALDYLRDWCEKTFGQPCEIN